MNFLIYILTESFLVIRLHSTVFWSVLVLNRPIEWLEAEFALEEPLPVCAHVPQQHKSSREFLMADGALEGLLAGMVPHVVVQHVLPVEGFRAVWTLEVLQKRRELVNKKILIFSSIKLPNILTKPQIKLKPTFRTLKQVLTYRYQFVPMT